MRLIGANTRQLIARGVDEALAKPNIWLVGVGMNAVDNALLAVAKKFNLLARVTVRRDHTKGDLIERRVRPERYCALWWLPDPDDDVCFIFEPPPHEVLYGLRRVR